MKNILLFIALIFTFWACHLLPDDHINEGCDRSSYTFGISVSFEPKDSIIHVGDTITITSQFSNMLSSNETNELFLFDSVDFHMGGGIIKLDTFVEKGKSYNFMDNFEWIVDSIYNLRKGSISFAIDFYYSENKYFVILQMIPKKSGVYLFNFNSLIATAHSVNAEVIYAKNTDCRTNNWNPNFITNAGNNYKELLLQSPQDYYTGYYYENWSRYNTIYGAHCFVVE